MLKVEMGSGNNIVEYIACTQTKLVTIVLLL